ncbi:DUF3667 domain-containing protein [Caulobacter segnis]|uniref:DUF3667 domain-containing protein n=1 Tax=Caulobacter segnis TaxID=88688 RepID=UPI00240FECF9|nr:DUF3667 domain-containing protein [Caulobacter segnis]MDG2521243.1 DUF3667 domain-containing protein [Caulobacter segnis]
MDIDAAGVGATHGLIGGAVERGEGKAGEHHAMCADCGAQTSGKFCSNCGQPTHVHRSLLHLGEEILHGVMHFDSRIWRTLPLLFLNPGRLTREWIEGKRSRYVSPLGMYLFTVFVVFMLLSFAPAARNEGEPSTAAAARPPVSGTTLFRAANEVTQAEVALENLPAGASPEVRNAAVRRVTKARVDLEAANEAMSNNPSAPDVGAITNDWARELQSMAAKGDIKVNTGDKNLDKKLKKKLQNPELALYKIQQTFYKFSFLLIPISIPFVALLFVWKRQFTLYDHGVFVLYSLTFIAILLLLASVAMWGGAKLNWVSLAIMLAVPTHMYAQLKGAYGLSVFSTIWRLWFLLIFCAVTLSLFLTAIVMLGLTG